MIGMPAMSLAAALPDIGGQPSLGSILDRPVPSAGPVRAPILGGDACPYLLRVFLGTQDQHQPTPAIHRIGLPAGAPVLAASADRPVYPQLRTYRCIAANRRCGPKGDLANISTKVEISLDAPPLFQYSLKYEKD
jgi:hypothetical protein